MNTNLNAQPLFAYAQSSAAAEMSNGITPLSVSGTGKEMSGTTPFADLLYQLANESTDHITAANNNVIALFPELLRSADGDVASAIQPANEDLLQGVKEAVQWMLNDDAILEGVYLDPLLQLWLQQAALIIPQLFDQGALQNKQGDTATTGQTFSNIAEGQEQTAQLFGNGQGAIFAQAETKTILVQFAAMINQEAQHESLRPLVSQFQSLLNSLVPNPASVRSTDPTADEAALLTPSAAKDVNLQARVTDPELFSIRNSDLPAIHLNTAKAKPLWMGTTAAVTELSSHMLQTMAAKAAVVPQGVIEALSAAGYDVAESWTTNGTYIAGVNQPGETVQVLADGQQARNVAGFVVREQHFVQDMNKWLLGNMKFSSENGLSEARIVLHPQHLGQVNIKLTMENGVLTGQFMAETLMGKEMLENQLPQLRHALQNLGLQVDKLAVNQSGEWSSGMFHEQRQHQPSQQFTGQNKNRDSSYSFHTEGDDSTAEPSYAITGIDDGKYGGSFHAIA